MDLSYKFLCHAVLWIPLLYGVGASIWECRAKPPQG